MARTDAARPRLRDIAVQVLAICRARWRSLLIAGFVVFIPLGLVDVLAERLHDDLTGDDTATFIAASVAASVAAVAALVGEVLYAGVVAGLVVADREGREHSFRGLVSHLPRARLFAVDALAALVIAVGFLFLIVPGILFLGWFALVAPAVEVEDRRPIAAFRRSRELVRGHLWLVLGVVLPVLVIEDALSVVVQSASWLAVGETFAGDWAGAVVTNVASSLFYAVAVTVLFLELRASRGARPSPRTPPRWRRRSRRAAAP
ncbi:MAG TPA: hypothetical protein VK326_09620 [Solirubrobacterales bacterium]|nr:hypothetical protein [Solirubrobacterales bacterium]